MAQQLNLNDPRFTPRRLRASARHSLLAMAGLLLLCFAAGQGLRWQAGHSRDQSLALQAGLATQRSALLAQSPAQAHQTQGQNSPEAEVARLQQLDAAQRRILAALDQGVAGTSHHGHEGHAGYLMALARQASAQLWLTGFSVSEDGRDIDLEGRMSDANALPGYLRGLNAEPRFKGRPFAQLSLKAVDGEPYTAFALRSSSPTGSKP